MMNFYIPFLDFEAKALEILKSEEKEIKCSNCLEYEYCVSGEPLVIPCPAERKSNDC